MVLLKNFHQKLSKCGGPGMYRPSPEIFLEKARI
jgi:hypothetical protein